jgi:DNA-binding NarL/FixJ family response regulator
MSGAPLSKQETKIVAALSTGSLYKEIASDHQISINTVKKHLKSIYRKMNVNKRTQAAELFLQSQMKVEQPMAAF